MGVKRPPPLPVRYYRVFGKSVGGMCVKTNSSRIVLFLPVNVEVLRHLCKILVGKGSGCLI